MTCHTPPLYLLFPPPHSRGCHLQFSIKQLTKNKFVHPANSVIFLGVKARFAQWCELAFSDIVGILQITNLLFVYHYFINTSNIVTKRRQNIRGRAASAVQLWSGHVVGRQDTWRGWVDERWKGVYVISPTHPLLAAY